MTTLKIPGKLYIIGEYSILKPGNEAIVCAIDKFINVSIDAATDYEFESDLGRFKWMLSEKLPVLFYDTLTHAKAAVYVAHLYLKHLKVIPTRYKIKLDSELNSIEHKKYGLGSSGAVIVSIIKGILIYHNVSISNIDLFKLAVLAQIEISDITSGGELAASIYGGVVSYRRYDLLWVLENKGKLDILLNSDWPMLEIEKLNQVNLDLSICYSGESIETKSYTDKVNLNNSGSWYNNFMSKTYMIVRSFKDALIHNDYDKLYELTELYRNELMILEKNADITIESEPFKKMISIANNFGLAAKHSGAGFGDCGFALIKKSANKEVLEEAWKLNGLFPLKMKVWDYND